MKRLLFLASVLSSASAFANIAIECGTQVNTNDGIVGKRVFLLSSEDGPVMAYDRANQKIRGSVVKRDPNGNYILTITMDQGLGGDVGTKYIVKNPRGENFTTAQKFVMGGYAGGSQVGTLTCVVSED